MGDIPQAKPFLVKLSINFLMLILSGIFSLGICEIMLRIFWNNPFFGMHERYIYLVQSKTNLDISYQWPWGKVRFRTNSVGLIEPVSISPNTKLTIAFLGGSTTECLAVNEDLRFPVLVGKILSKDLGYPITSYNFGRRSANTHHAINTLFNVIQFYEPNTCVLMNAYNDFGVLASHGTYQKWRVLGNNYITAEHFLNWLAARLAFFGLIRKIKVNYDTSAMLRIREHRNLSNIKWFQDFNKGIFNERIIKYKTNLKNFIDICRNHGVRPVLMTQLFNLNESGRPTLAFRMFPDDALNYMGLMNQALREVANNNQVQCIDLARSLMNKKEYLYDGLHLNNSGSQMVSKIIATSACPIRDNHLTAAGQE